MSVGVGDEGGFAQVKSNEEPFELIVEAISPRFRAGKDVGIACDPRRASSSRTAVIIYVAKNATWNRNRWWSITKN